MASKGDNATSTFSFKLDSNAAEVGADSAAAIGLLQEKLQTGTAALRQMQQALRNLKSGGVEAESSIKGLKDQIAAQRATIASAQGAYLKLGGGFGAPKVKKEDINPFQGFEGFGAAAKAQQEATDKTRSKILGLAKSLDTSGGKVAGFLGKLTSLSASQLLWAAAIGVSVVALGALAAATAKATYDLAKYGVEAANARRSEMLRLEGLTKIRYFMFGFGDGFGRAADKADFLQSTIDSVSQSVALGRDKIVDYATQLYKMGLRGGNLQAALKGVAITAATQGDAQASAFANWAAGANLVGQSVKALSADVEGRLGKIAKAQLLDLNVQTEKLHESFQMLFSGLKIDRLLEGISSITSLFSQSTVTGQELKRLMSVIFQPLIDSAADGTPIIKRFIQGMILAAQELVIMWLKVRIGWTKAFGDHSLLKAIGATNIALNLGKIVIYGFVGAFIALGAVIGYFTADIIAAAAMWGATFAFLKRAFDFFVDTDWSELGHNIVKGIAEGIANGAHWVKDEILKLGANVGNWFKDKLGIHSPSRVMMGHGFMVGAGVAAGIRGSAPVAFREVDRMGMGIAGREMAPPPIAFAQVEAPSVAIGASGAARAGAGIGGGGHVEIHEIVIQTQASDARGIAHDIRRELEAILSGAAAHLGAEGSA